MLELGQLDAGSCRLFLKLELQNPAGSIKDRIGLSMIEEAERRGALRPGGTIIEATAGNTGLGLALVALQKGYRVVLVLPDKMSQEKIFNLRAMGAEVVLTRSDVEKGHPEYYQDLATSLARGTRLLPRQPVRQPGQPAGAPTDDGPGDPRADGGRARRGRRRHRLERHDHGAHAVLPRAAADRGNHPRGPGGLSARGPGEQGKLRQGGLLAGRGHRRGLHPGDLRLLDVPQGLQHSRHRVLRGRARDPAQGGAAGRFFHRHAGRRGAALVPRAVAAEARRDFRLRHGQQVPVEAVQRLLDGRPGLHPASTAPRPARPGRQAARRARDGRSWDRTTCSRPRTTACAMPATASSRSWRASGWSGSSTRTRSSATRSATRNGSTTRCPGRCSATFPWSSRRCPCPSWSAMLESTPYVAVIHEGAFHGLITRADVLNYLRRQMTATQ